MKPKNEFYKFLAKKPKKSSSMHERKLHLWIPDTIVYNDGSNQPFWVYTGSDGIVRKTEDFTEKDIISKMANQFKLDELICIAKQGSDGAVVELLNARDIVTKIPMFS